MQLLLLLFQIISACLFYGASLIRFFFYCISFHPPLFKYNILLFSFSFLFASLSFFPTLSFTSHFQPITSLSYISLLILSLTLFLLFLFFLFLSRHLLLYYLSSLISSLMLCTALTDNSSHLS